jgi:Tol biopolymer transport system component
VSPDGGEVRTLEASADSCCPVWSPDGTQLLVQRGAEGARDLWILDVSGEVVGQVTQAPGDYFGYGWGAGG